MLPFHVTSPRVQIGQCVHALVHFMSFIHFLWTSPSFSLYFYYWCVNLKVQCVIVCDLKRNGEIQWVCFRLQHFYCFWVCQWTIRPAQTNLYTCSTFIFFFLVVLFEDASVHFKHPALCRQAVRLSSLGILRNIVAQYGSSLKAKLTLYVPSFDLGRNSTLLFVPQFNTFINIFTECILSFFQIQFINQTKDDTLDLLSFASWHCNSES